MNDPSIDWLTSQEAAGILSDAAGFADDSDLNEAITYKRYNSTSVNPSTGVETISTTDFSINAVKFPISLEEKALGIEPFTISDFKFFIDRQEVTGELSTEDWIIDADGVRHDIIEVRDTLKNWALLIFTRSEGT